MCVCVWVFGLRNDQALRNHSFVFVNYCWWSHICPAPLVSIATLLCLNFYTFHLILRVWYCRCAAPAIFCFVSFQTNRIHSFTHSLTRKHFFVEMGISQATNPTKKWNFLNAVIPFGFLFFYFYTNVHVSVCLDGVLVCVWFFLGFGMFWISSLQQSSFFFLSLNARTEYSKSTQCNTELTHRHTVDASSNAVCTFLLTKFDDFSFGCVINIYFLIYD